MPRFSRARIPKITPAQWGRARGLFAEEGALVTPAQLRSAAGLRRDAAFSLILGIYEEKHADLYLLVYHTCSEAPVARRAYATGLQPLPWHCPYCDETVTKRSELRYELEASVRSPIEFVD